MAVAVVFALTVVMLLIGPKMLGEGVIALLYLVPIGWCTVRWGQIAGISAALTAALVLRFSVHSALRHIQYWQPGRLAAAVPLHRRGDPGGWTDPIDPFG